MLTFHYSFITILLCFVDDVYKKGYDSEKFNIALGEGTGRDPCDESEF